MEFDIFCEVQRARPWPSDHEPSLLRETIEQARAADEAGFGIWWQVEHHGSPEFSYSCAPDLILLAIAHATQRMHVGHAGVLAPFRINHPLRIAERGAMLDLLSGGRLELGLAKSSLAEWETFGAAAETAREELREAMYMVPRMWTEPSFSYTSPLLSIPEREVRPRPLQVPHPRLWQTAGSPESFRMAGEMGVGVLGMTLLSPVAGLGRMLREYEAGLASCTHPAGRTVNSAKAIFTFVHLADSREAAIASGAAWSALWYVHQASIIFKVPHTVWYEAIRSGLHPNSARPGEGGADEIPVIALLERMVRGEEISNEEAHEAIEPLDSVVIGTPEECARKLRAFEEIRTDRLMCLVQFGRIPHAAILRSIELIGAHLIPAFRRARA